MKFTQWLVSACLILTLPSVANDRAVRIGDWLYLADEPGLADCPDLACNIPVDLAIQKRQGAHFQEVNRIQLTQVNSGDHNLYLSNQQLVSVYSNRLQNVGEKAIFTTRMTAFSLADPLHPRPIASAKVPGELFASQQVGDHIVTASAEVVARRNGDGNDANAEADECTWFHRDETLPFRLKIHLLSLNTKSLAPADPQCLILDVKGISTLDLGAGNNSLHLLLSDGERHRIYRYRWQQQQLSLHGYAQLPSPFAFQNPTHMIAEQFGHLLVAGQYPSDSGNTGAVGVFALHSSSQPYPLSKTLPIGNAGSIIDSASKVTTDKRWYLASSSNDGAQLHALSVLLPGLPLELTSTALDSSAQTIIAHPQQLLSVYRSALPMDGQFEPQQWLTLIDNSNALRLWTVDQQLLGTGFSQQALATADTRRQTLHFTSRRSAKLLNAIEAPILPMSDQSSETPIGRALDLKTSLLERQPGCLSVQRSCWSVRKGVEHNFELPYFGAEPIRAVAMPADDQFHYVLGKDSQTLAW
ncbi:hypothetical protein CHH28_04435 [Bacterioplanes sanyensis]|uniref:Uncharacterized protein n=2 Tax=Bacterioplanes sanyensis TaxID=1249553 RepID=A0A222FH66_9GAMM|nr:hypothetical protein CHH28_04435 [Bacterioplanes sanyensis]